MVLYCMHMQPRLLDELISIGHFERAQEHRRTEIQIEQHRSSGVRGGLLDNAAIVCWGIRAGKIGCFHSDMGGQFANTANAKSTEICLGIGEHSPGPTAGFLLKAYS